MSGFAERWRALARAATRAPAPPLPAPPSPAILRAALRARRAPAAEPHPFALALAGAVVALLVLTCAPLAPAHLPAVAPLAWVPAPPLPSFVLPEIPHGHR